MQTITTIGLDIAKSVFQVHGVDAVGQAVIRRQLKRRHVLTFPDRNFNMRTLPGFPALPKNEPGPGENTAAEPSPAFARSDCLHLAALISERASPRGFSIGLRAGGLWRTARLFRLLGRRRSHGDRVVGSRAAYRLDFHWR